MLNILAIYPAFDININEMAMVWKKLCDSGQVKCTIFAGARDVLKGGVAISLNENYKNMEIIRLGVPLVSRSAIDQMCLLTVNQKPDLVFCAIAHNLPAAIAIQRCSLAPIFLHEEFLSDERIELKRRDYFGIDALRPWVIRQRARRLSQRCDRIFCSNPAEFNIKGSNKVNGDIFYLPWPHPYADAQSAVVPRLAQHVVYIGSISKVKGALALRDYVLALLKNEPDLQFTLVGPATDKLGECMLSEIRQVGGARVNWIAGCPRPRAIELISSARFVISPGKLSNWGLIGDAWNSGTPIIAAASHYDLKSESNCLIAGDSDEFVYQARRLLSDDALWLRLVDNGLTTVRQKHSVEVVAERLLRGLTLSVQFA